MSAMTDNLILTLWVGAARADSDAAGLIVLRAFLIPLMERYAEDSTVTAADIIKRVQESMPTGWVPTGDWAKQIEALGGTIPVSGSALKEGNPQQ
jgi:hypothetical protein